MNESFAQTIVDFIRFYWNHINWQLLAYSSTRHTVFSSQTGTLVVNEKRIKHFTCGIKLLGNLFLKRNHLEVLGRNLRMSLNDNGHRIYN